LGKKVTNTVTNLSKTTWYVGDFIYEESNSQIDLTTILNEEGRVRVFQPTTNARVVLGGNYPILSSSMIVDTHKGVFEFFVKDHLQNTRMILSEETHSEMNNCTMENPVSAYEERMFGQVDASGNPISGSNEVILTRKDRQTFAIGWQSNSSSNVSRLKQEEQKIGPNNILKVMAGDEISAYVDYYYTGAVDNTGSNGILNQLLNTLLPVLSNTAPAGVLHGSAGSITNNFSLNPGDLGNFLSSQNNSSSTTPQAYLNIMFFDENFNFISYDNVSGIGSNAWRVLAAGDGQAPLVAANIKAPKNGYAFVYLSNESKTPVYFDNFTVTHNRGRIVEENAYYPYGLRIKGLSAKAFEKGNNGFGYQSDFSEEEEGAGWNEFSLRMYDPQIGRWTGVDPYDEFASPYIGMGMSPINFVDEDGGAIGAGGWGAIGGSIGGYVIAHRIAIKNGASGFSAVMWGLAGSFVGAGIGYAIGESLSPAEGNFTGNSNQSHSFFGNLMGFYKGFFTGGNDPMWRWNRNQSGGPADGLCTANIWANIKLGSPFEWIPESKDILGEVLVVSKNLGLLIGNPDVFQRFPDYSGSIVLPENNGDLYWRFEPYRPGGHYNINVNGADNGGSISPSTTSLEVKINLILRSKDGGAMTDYEEHMRQMMQWKRAGLDTRMFEDNWKMNIQSIVQFNNSVRINVYKKAIHTKKYRYLRVFKFIKLNFEPFRKKGW
jgi:RHS repeat-associated protein